MTPKTRALLLCGLLTLTAACSVKKVDEAHVGVKYTDGPIEGKKWDGVVEPGGSHTVVNDHVYMLPARQVTFITGGTDQPCAECDRTALRFTAKGGVDMKLDLATRFFLNSKEEALKPFFLEICQKHDCWSDEGWVKMLNETFGNPMEAVVRDIGLEFDPEKLRYDGATKDEFAKRFAQEFVKSQERLVGRGDYFCGPGYDRKKETCPDLSVEVTGVTFANADRESVHEREELSKAQERLAAQELLTAQAQQATNAAKATPQNLDLMEREAMLACAKNPQGCNLTVIVGEDGVSVAVPAG